MVAMGGGGEVAVAGKQAGQMIAKNGEMAMDTAESGEEDKQKKTEEEAKKKKEEEEKPKEVKVQDKSRPISSTPVPGTPW